MKNSSFLYQVDKIINEHFDISKFNSLISPFFSNGLFELYFKNKYKKQIIVNNKIDISNLDFEKFINKYHSNNDIMYIDAPYCNIYRVSNNLHKQFDHNRLYKVINNKYNWILIYNNSEYIRELYKDYIIIDLNYKNISSDIVIISKYNNMNLLNIYKNICNNHVNKLPEIIYL